MRKNIVTSITLIACLLYLGGCGGHSSNNIDSGETSTASIPANTAPLNISIFLDLSDRLTRDLTPSQMERDTALINILIDQFINTCVQKKILLSKDRIKVLFYPTPSNPNIVAWAKALEVDMDKIPAKEKKLKLLSMKDDFNASLSEIYKEALNAKNFIGCDIWAFFSDEKVDVQCMEDNYRNIIIILTDGYLFYEYNKIKEGDAYSYVLPQTLAVPSSSLICKREGLSDLEVLMLEVNPYKPAHRDKLFSVLENWFKEMGIEKIKIVDTDLPNNTKAYIDKFFVNK